MNIYTILRIALLGLLAGINIASGHIEAAICYIVASLLIAIYSK